MKPLRFLPQSRRGEAFLARVLGWRGVSKLAPYSRIVILTVLAVGQSLGEENSATFSDHDNALPERREIQGGREVSKGDWPFVVFLSTGTEECTASLVASEWVLTAAHCVADDDGQLKSRNFLVSACHDHASPETCIDNAYRIRHKRVVVHPKYRGVIGHPKEWDMALIQLERPINGVRPVRLLNISEEKFFFEHGGDNTGIAVGWGEHDGEVETDTSNPTKPWEVAEEIHLSAACKGFTEHEVAFLFDVGGVDFSTGTMCFNDFHRGTDSGDSGGPLLVHTLDGLAQIGVSSAMSDQAGANWWVYRGPSYSLSLFGRVSYNYDWIVSHIGPVRQPPWREAPQRALNAAVFPFRDCEGCPEMVPVQAGTFTMGDHRYPGSRPVRRVAIPTAFAIGAYEVTFREWDECVRAGGCDGYSPSDEGWGRGRRPVMNVSWHDAKAYVDWLSRRTGQVYRLPSEAEWEYAARAGVRTRWILGDGIKALRGGYRTVRGNPSGWWGDGNVLAPRTIPVGAYVSNRIGLYDVIGNVDELTEDCWNGNLSGAPDHGLSWQAGDCERRVAKGGNFKNHWWTANFARRTWRRVRDRASHVGFRVVREFRSHEAVYHEFLRDEVAVAPPRGQEEVTNGVGGMSFVQIPVGRFSVASTSGSLQSVEISEPFYMGKYEVTQRQWRAVMGGNPSHFSDCGLNCPVENVSWDLARVFVSRLNGLRDGYHYFLPTDAQWEYAARAGTDDGRYMTNLDAIAWWNGNSGGQPHPVGRKRPNSFGLHDMLGNVWEWVHDNGRFTHRGCGWNSPTERCRAAEGSRRTWMHRDNQIGLRVAMVPDNPSGPPLGDDHGQTFSAATVLHLGSPVDGRIEFNSDTDLFVLTIGSSEVVEVFTAGSLDTYGTLTDTRGQILVQDDDDGSGSNFRIERTLDPGTYYVRVESYENASTGSYTLHARSKDIHSNEPSGATELQIQTSVDGMIDPAIDADVFRLQIQNRSPIAIYTTGSLDTVGTLTDSSGQTLAVNDDGGDATNFRIEHILDEGVYFVRVESFQNGSEGSYTIRAELASTELHAEPLLAFVIGGAGVEVLTIGRVNGGFTEIPRPVELTEGAIERFLGEARAILSLSEGGDAVQLVSVGVLTSMDGTAYQVFQIAIGDIEYWYALVVDSVSPDHAEVIATFAGTGEEGYGGDGGTAVQAQLSWPEGVAVDAHGNVYIAERHRVRKVDGNGMITTIAGTGAAGYGGDGGPAERALLNWPTGVAADARGNVYIADSSNRRVRKVNSAGVITTFAGTGEAGYGGDGGLAVQALLFSPSSVAADAYGNVYIADTENNTVRKVDATGVITTLAGTGEEGRFEDKSEPAPGDGGPAAEATLWIPSGVAVDSDGHVYFSDGEGSRVRKVDSASGIISTFAGTGERGSTGDGGPATGARLLSAVGVAADARGNVYIADHGKVWRVDSTGVITTFAGTGEEGYGGDGGQASQAILAPDSLAVNLVGDVYIAESRNHRVRVVRTAASVGPGILDDHGDDPSSATGLGLGNRVAGRIDPASDSDVFRIEIDSRTGVRIFTTGSLDTVGTLTDSSGRPLAQDDDGGDGFNFEIDQTLSEGTYYARVESYANDSVGSYIIYAEHSTPVTTAVRAYLDREWMASATSARLENLLDSGASAFAMDAEARTPLHYAAWVNSDPAVAEALLNRRAVVGAVDAYGRSPLHYAALGSGNLAVAEVLVEWGADPFQLDNDSKTPRALAAERGNAAVAALLAAREEVLSIRDPFQVPTWQLIYGDWGRTATIASVTAILDADPSALTTMLRFRGGLLHRIARYNPDPAVTRVLLDRGADPNSTTKTGVSVLVAASRNPNPAVTELLLARGADPTEPGALRSAALNPNPAVAELLLARGADPTDPGAIANAAQNRNPAVTELLLTRGADPNAVYGSRTPLHRAALNPNAAVAELLLDHGAQINQFDYTLPGRTALHWAIVNRDDSVARLLIERGADIEAKNSDGLSPLARAASVSANPAVVQLLLDAGARTDLMDVFYSGDSPTWLSATWLARGSLAQVEQWLDAAGDHLAAVNDVYWPGGLTAMHYAVRNPNPAVADLLLSRGAAIFEPEVGRALLHEAARFNPNQAVTELLMDIGVHLVAGIQSGESDVWTPLHWAALANPNPAVTGILVDFSADFWASAFDEGTWTPLHAAARFNPNPAVAELLVERGANPGARDDGDATPLVAAWLNRRSGVAAALLAKGAQHASVGQNRLLDAYWLQNATVAQLEAQVVSATDADFQATDACGRTPLHLLAHYTAREDFGSFSLTHYGRGWDLFYRRIADSTGRQLDGHGNTAFHYAVAGAVRVDEATLSTSQVPGARLFNNLVNGLGIDPEVAGSGLQAAHYASYRGLGDFNLESRVATWIAQRGWGDFTVDPLANGDPFPNQALPQSRLDYCITQLP